MFAVLFEVGFDHVVLVAEPLAIAIAIDSAFADRHDVIEFSPCADHSFVEA